MASRAARRAEEAPALRTVPSARFSTFPRLSLDAIVWVMRNSEATLGSRLVLLVLAEYAHEDGTKAFPKVETIAQKARMSRKGVQAALRRLEEATEIACTGATKSGTKVYSILGMEGGENLGDSGDKGGEVRVQGGEAASSRGEVTTPDPVDDPSDDPLPADVLSEAWGKLAPPLIAHPQTIFRSKRFTAAVKAALLTYELPQIVKAIENYAAVLASKQHYWTHRYSAIEFLSRPRATPGVDHFVDEAMPLENFHTARDRDADGGQQRTPEGQRASAEAWILNTAWRLPLEDYEVAEQLGQRGIEGPDRTRLLELWQQKRDLADAA